MVDKSPIRAGRRGFVIAYGNFVFRYRNVMFPVTLVAILALFHPVFAFHDARVDLWLDVVGIAIGLFGVLLRAAVVGIAYIKRGGRNRRIAADTLVTEGLFAHSRNPLYLGNLLVVAGISVVANNPWFYLIGGAFFLFSYHAMVLSEERFLGAKFGAAYLDYCRRVPRWGIQPRGLRATLTRSRINWRLIVVKEYSSIATWILLNLAVFGFEEFENEPFALARPEIMAAAVAVAMVGLVVVALRVMKKRGWLVPNPG